MATLEGRLEARRRGDSSAQLQQEAERWMRSVGHASRTAASAAGRGIERQLLELIKRAEVAEADGEEGMGAGELRAQIRSAVMGSEVSAAAARAARFVEFHSETVPWLLTFLPPCLTRRIPALQVRAELGAGASLFSSGVADAALQLGAALCMLLTLPLAAAWLVATVAFVPLAAVVPLLQPAQRLSSGDALPLLPATLSLCYLLCLLAGAALLPAVARFQRNRVELGAARSFPAPFYTRAMAVVIITRCEAAVQAAYAFSQRGTAPPLLRFGDDCTICLKKIGAKERALELPACGHSFHLGCIEAWLQVSSVCPNCRCEHVADSAL